MNDQYAGEDGLVKEIERLRRRVEELESAEAVRRHEIEENPATIEALMDYIPEAITIVSAQDRIIRMASSEALKLMEAEREEVEGNTMDARTERWPVYHLDGHRLTEDEFPLSVALNEARIINDFEMLLVKPGQRVHLLANAGPIFDKAGKLLGAVAVWRDISDMKRAEKALKESEGMLAESQRIAQVGSWIWDLEKDLFCGSGEAYRIFGKKLNERIDYNNFINTVHPDDRAAVNSAVARALRGEPYRAEYRIIAEGRTKHILALGSAQFLDGKAVSMRGTIQDITESKKRENELKDALARIKTLSGLIPICANCKRIRDDKGYWMRIEKYIEERSAAEFTHSLCPECEEKLYGEEKRK